MSELTREKLLPCQFCGSEAKRKRILKIDHALCTRCGTCTGIGLWNTRSTPSALTARSEGFREGVEAAAKVCDAYLWAPVCAAAIRSLPPRETDAKTEGEPFPVELMSHSMDDDKRLMARKILKLQRIEKAYCAANDYINALTGTASIPPESLKKIEAAYWQAVKEVQ